LNIDRLQVEKKIERLRKSVLCGRPFHKRGYYDWIASARFQDDCNVMLAALTRRGSPGDRL
jgi:hypothetical protein